MPHGVLPPARCPFDDAEVNEQVHLGGQVPVGAGRLQRALVEHACLPVQAASLQHHAKRLGEAPRAVGLAFLHGVVRTRQQFRHLTLEPAVVLRAVVILDGEDVVADKPSHGGLAERLWVTIRRKVGGVTPDQVVELVPARLRLLD